MGRTLTMEDLPQELATRRMGGIEVVLLWSIRSGRALVTVHDESTGERLAVPVREADCALDVFYHPYAYAERRAA
jgi:hypothetical protein